VLAIDTSIDALEDLRTRVQAPNVSYFVGRVDVLPLMDDSVDAVLTGSALLSVDDATEAACELFRVLSRGGRVSICGEGELEQVLTRAGFSDVRTEAVYLTAVKP
jgi:ubiquinone/menaquinone biosynthesis C-methylase UbiE